MPLGGIVIAAVIAIAVLPSALNLPNTNPSTQLELAPVPPSNSRTPPPASNFALLSNASGPGLGSGAGGGQGGGGSSQGTLAPLTLPNGQGAVPPSTYDCVAGRQTSDPLSPPCVPYYEGNNGGSTYQGVSAKFVNVLIYYDAYGTLNTARGEDQPPYGTIINLLSPSSTQYNIGQVIVNRSWMYYFNKRYATYDRWVDFFVQFGTYDDQGVETPGTQTADAAYGYSKVHPFAVINYSSFGNGEYYNDYMAQHGVLIFGSAPGRSESFYQQFPGLQWGYLPPIERSASQYAQFVCNALKGRPADEVGSGNLPATIANGQARRYGLIYTTDPAFQTIEQEALDAAADIRAECGITPYDTATFPQNSYAVNTGQTPTYATDAMTRFQSEHITTILWPAGMETNFSNAAAEISYYPEWVLGDDSQQSDGFDAQFQNQSEWNDAWIMTSRTYTPPLPSQEICYQAYRSVDQTAADSDVEHTACPEYPDLRQMFTGIQVAGPDLSPQSVDTGFHAIPAEPSTSPQTPSCFYLPNDYTCVKDSAIWHWSSSAQSQASSQPGCWLMVDGGRRFLPGSFPHADLAQLASPSDQCNNYYNTIQIQY